LFLLNRFLREVAVNGVRVKVVSSLDEINFYLNKYNGKANLYTTVFPATKANGNNKLDYNTVIIDKMFFDIDIIEPDKVIDDIKKLHEWAEQNSYYHSINFSGRGFHFFIYVKPYDKPDKKAVLLNAQSDIIEELNLSKNVDRTVVGDVSREVRLLDSINLKSGLYVIPVKIEEVDNVKELAKSWRPLTKDFLYGVKLYDISSYSNGINYYSLPSINYSFDDPEIKEFQKQVNINPDVAIEKLKEVPCLKQVLENDNAGWYERTFLLIFLKENGFTEAEADEILHRFISLEKWQKSSCTRYHAHTIYSRSYALPSCDTLFMRGICPLSDCKTCPFYNNLSLKVVNKKLQKI